jgi:hypothetical protein
MACIKVSCPQSGLKGCHKLQLPRLFLPCISINNLLILKLLLYKRLFPIELLYLS